MNCNFSPKQALLLFAFCLLAPIAQAQFLQVTDVVTGPYNPQTLISNVFLGEGVEVTSINFNGDPRSVGYFSGGTPSIGIERGIVLTSGFSLNAVDEGMVQASDGNAGGSIEPSLSPIATGDLNDVAVYTITFIPNADTLRFRYSFASEEYPEYACTNFNDVFGFFIQGPGYPAFTNIARVPGTNLPVSINNVHPANPAAPPCPPFNAQYYNDNLGSMLQPVYDGFTDVFTAIAVVTPCQPYTIKLAIADVGDAAYDSGVFLEAKSFGTGSLQVNAATISADGTIAEGCTQGTVNFTLPELRSSNYTVNFNVFGSATPGTDYQTIPSNLVIPAGQSTISIPIIAFSDGIAEAPESIGISVQVDPCNRDTVILFIRDRILEPPIMADTSVCLPNTPVQLSGTVPTPVPAPPTFTNGTVIDIPNGNFPINSTVTSFGVMPPTIGPGVIRSVCINVEHSWISDVDAYLVSPNGIVLELTTDNGGDGNNYSNTCFTPTATVPISFPGPFAPSSAAPFTGNWLPEGPWTDLYGEPSNGNWRLRINDDQNNINGKLLNWTMTFEPSYGVTYQWSPAGGLSCTDCPNPVASPPVSAIYTVTATDSYGCTATDDVQVNIGAIAAGITITQPILCHGQKATILANATGNNTYLWNTGQTTASLSNLSAGTYTVTITSVGAFCTSSASVTITEPSELLATASPNDVTCFGLSTGTAAVYPSGGVSPYSYAWNNAMTTDSISNLLPGTYTVTITDNNGCTEISSMQVFEPALLQIVTALNRQPSCFGGSDGQLTTYALGGTTPFDFVWNTGQVNQGITSITAGTYTVTATDGNGCSAVKTETVTEPPLLTGLATPIAVKCFGKNNGSLQVQGSGGTPQYSASWTGPNGYVGNGLNINNLFAGQYQATLTDSKGCIHTLTASVTEPPLLVLNMPAVSDTVCFMGNNGTATVQNAGGTSPYKYLWSAGSQTTQTATGLVTNQYQVTVTDANGCTAMSETFIHELQELNTYAEAVAPGCHDGVDGTGAVLSIFYGAVPANVNDFTYRWNTSPPQFTQNVTGLQGGKTYMVTATDALGCTATTTVQVANPLELETFITGNGDVKCFGDATGWASAKAEGGTAPYNWFWNGGSSPTDSIAQGLAAGTYRVTITDANGCPGTNMVNIGQPSELRVSLQPIHVGCFGESTGSAKATGSGGVNPYQYIWENGTTTTSIANLAAGTYRISITDFNGCITPGNVTVEQPAEPVSGTATMQPPKCHGGFDGRIFLTGMGGTAPYRYALDNKPFNGSPVQIGIPAGSYTPRIVDANGCDFELTPIEVTQPNALEVDLGPDFEILFGEDAQLFAEVANAQGPVLYAWNLADSTWLSCMDCINPAVYSLEFTRFFGITVSDSLGCRATDMVRIAVEKPRKVFVPTGFTPNGDFNNDLLLVHGQSTSKVLDFKIFDRWGEMVFQLQDFAFNDDTKGWDGNFRGQPCDPGVFVWILEVEYVDGEKEVFKGNTTLIR
jgi:gliding motility-associated-like protein